MIDTFEQKVNLDCGALSAFYCPSGPGTGNRCGGAAGEGLHAGAPPSAAQQKP